jgi:hypothetical protein
VAVPVPPGTIGEVEDDVVKSAEPGATAIDDDDELFAGVGSAVAVDTPAVPPVSATPGVADAGILIGMRIAAVVAPAAIGPGWVQEIGPAGIVPLQPLGSETIDAPAGGLYVNTTGPAASEGPAFEAVNDTFPVVPGVIDGVVTATETSAAAGATLASLVAPLFAGVASAVGDEASTEPPLSVAPGVADAESFNGMSSVTLPPTGTGPATAQEIGPPGMGPAHPVGSDAISAPAGGL